MKKAWRPYTDAKAFVHTLGFKNQQEWRGYCQSGQRPADIPSNPSEAYKEAFEGMGVWIGNATRTVKKRPFLQARAFVHRLGLNSQQEWKAYCQSSQRPNDIPTDPRKAYHKEFVSMGDWLGTDRVACQYRIYRPFPEARTFVQALGLQNEEEWIIYCRSGNKPDDIPAAPRRVYRHAFVSLGDWLGTGRIATNKQSSRSFEEARAFVRTLGLRNRREWYTYCRSGRKPVDIPTNPHRTYHTEFRGMGDWLGTITTWKRATLLTLLEDLRPHLKLLHERELYVILQQAGALPALRIALREPTTLAVLRRIMTQEAQALQKAIENEEVTIDIQESAMNNDEDVPEKLAVSQQGLLNDVLDEASQPNAAMVLEPSLVKYAYRKEQLHLVDHLARLPGHLDGEVTEYLITSRVSSLWEIYSQEGQQAIDHLLGEEEGGQFFSEIKHRFLAEVAEVERLDWAEAWAFTVNGRQAEPNVMQRRIAWLVREKRRVGNWSGVGSGKTLSALLSSRISHAFLTLIITNYPTISGWVQSIRNVYPDSLVSTDPQALLASDAHQYRYLVLNYEKFQHAGRHQLVQQLLTLGIQLIVLDEIQLVKQRETKISQRSKAVQTLISKASQRDPHLRVLGMSATPIIFSRVGSPLRIQMLALL